MARMTKQRLEEFKAKRARGETLTHDEHVELTEEGWAVIREFEASHPDLAEEHAYEMAARDTYDGLKAETKQMRGALEALVAEVAEKCCARAEETGPVEVLAEDKELICGKPARWGLLTGWTCDLHRREKDRNEIGGPALRAAFAVLEQKR